MALRRRWRIRYASLAFAEAAALVAEGLPGSEVTALQERLDLTAEQMADVVAIPDRTLARRKNQKRLPVDESERIYRVARLVDIAEGTFSDPGEAVAWFKEPNYALGDVSPLEMASTEPGARLVEQLLGRISYGIPA